MNKKNNKAKDTKTKKPKAKTVSKNDKKEFSLKRAKVSSKKFAEKYYISYTMRIVIYAVCFFLAIGLSLLLLTKAISVEKEKIVRYQETGNVDYKVYLKPNEFYTQQYLGKNQVYIASIIKNVTIDFNYQFLIEEPVNTNFSYQIVGKLSILGNQGSSALYQKDYVLVDKKLPEAIGSSIQNIKDSIVIDYDYYNEIANKFKTTYGVDATSDFKVYMRIIKSANNQEQEININETSEMNLSIPLTQRTLNIEVNDTAINNTKSIVQESKINFSNIFCGILAFLVFVLSVCCILKTLELLFVLIPKKSKYDKFINKILSEYDRLIVEIHTQPMMDNKEVFKLKKFEELLDARDNLKRPIMYYTLIPHQKSYFYTEKDNSMYLYVVKAADLEVEKDKKKK